MTTELDVKHLEIGNYFLDVVKVQDFKQYLEENERYFSANAYKAYLKTVDIPPKFFKEQPEETQKELLENRDTFVKENKKYFDKVIVVVRVKIDMTILNACRMASSDVDKRYEQLKTIEDVQNKFEHTSFVKDGYISYIISKDNDIKKDVDNKVLAVDFPIMLNKKAIIHKSFYTLPNDSFVTPVEHIQYISSDEIDFDMEYSDIKCAIDNFSEFFTEEIVQKEAADILREPEIVSLALVEADVIPLSYSEKIGNYIKENMKGVLNTWTLEQFVLDYDETLKGYKQRTNLRSVDGFKVLDVLNSDSFKEVLANFEAEEEAKEKELSLV